MASESPSQRRLGPFGIVLLAAFFLILLFWGFLCTRSADDALEGGSDSPASGETQTE